MVKTRSQKIGLQAGELVFVGNKQRTKAPLITLIDYNEGSFEERDISNLNECPLYKDKQTVTWINVEGNAPEILGKIGECFSIHPLVLEDILNTDQRPKMQEFDEYVFVVLKMFSLHPKTKEIITEQVSIILGKTFIISIQEGLEGDIFNPIRERIRLAKGRVRKLGCDYLMYSMIDQIVDHYFLLFEHLGERIEDLEDAVLLSPTPKTLANIHNLKKEMLLLRKSIWPLREEISNLIRSDSDLVTDNTKLYLRDVYEHTIQVIDTVETYRDMLSGMLDIYLSSISNRLNEVMKVLTVITTIFMPLTVITGMYGMNFKHMPELELWWWYPMVIGGMVAISVGMLTYFKIKKWL